MRCTRTKVAMWWCWCVMSCFVVASVKADNNSQQLENTVNQLQEQVRILMEQRQEMTRTLESLKSSISHSEMSTLKEEVEALRVEMATLRGSGSLNQQRNDHLTLQWLQGAVRELRGEVQTELTVAHNASELRAQENVALLSEVALLRSDVASTRADLETMRGEQTRSESETQQLQRELNAVRERTQNCASTIADTRAQLEAAQTKWSTTLRSHSKGNSFHSKFHGIFNDASTITELHHELHGTPELERRIRRVEKRLKSALWQHANAVGRSAEHAELKERVSALENATRSGARALFNVTKEIAGLERVQQSTAQLLESVSALESRLDTSLPELQREVSRLEFELAQAASSVQVARDAQEQQSSVIKVLEDNSARLEEGWNADRALLAVIQQHSPSSDQSTSVSSNHDVSASKSNAAAAENSSSSSSSSNTIRRLVRDLGQIEHQYRDIVHSLPKDCEAVTGPSGQYLIAPPLAPEEVNSVTSDLSETPMYASCDQDTNAGGWTVVQRRSNGAEEFNRHWSEYQAGFGSPAGEFWLGNGALRRLTADNCSSLRVDLHDIYGQVWFAEYTEFSIGSAEDGYRLWVSGYHGNASDAFEYQNMMQFSSVDSDRDISNTHCAANYEGGWWFSHCQHVNLNGRYNLGLTWFDASRNEWIAVAWSEMKVRRRPSCDLKH